ncbi:aspartate/glutamate racemase family protein [Phaeovulum vinaykumarii]|uniref:Allantoin racemase n=1 Tax=Phaeovulum vinaykumarii TaxID=407234 RepID=A0A1N7MBH4_9RHOB|nr:aspartate/glutamate racemase family protein [Phaeovulum vinaykumarii]SIS83329.1 allantoin racemase [Phaeovulum vinaykumarii]SOC10290.1 allantoin racemase [Phaeovulum vinaykumarii]
MTILFLNPNSTAAMTQSVVERARMVCPGTRIEGWTNHDAPAAIQGPEDGAAAVPGLLAMLPRARAEGVAAIVIACFDDTGLEALRAAAHCPVIGIGQAAFHMGALLGGRFSVVTTLPVSVPVIAENVARYGFAEHCAAIHASGLAVLEVEDGAPQTRDRLAGAIRAAGREDGVSTAILGCAGMTRLAEDMQGRTGLRVIDGVVAATHLAGALIAARA